MKAISDRLDNKNPPDAHGYTPLHLAALLGHLDVVVFISNNVKEKNPKTSTYWKETTPLHEAAEGGHLKIVKYLLKFVPDYENLMTSDGKTPYDMAKENGHEDTALLLKRK